MRHGKKINQLSRTASHRKAMMGNMAASLLKSDNKRIITTLAKAKALRTYVEPIITKSRTDTTHSRRKVFSYLRDKEAVKILFGEVSTKIGDRPGGYTRVLKLGPRKGDNAEMALIELVDYNEFLQDAPAKKKSRRRKKKAAPAAEVVETVQETVEEVQDNVEEVVEEQVEAAEETATEEPAAEEKSEEVEAAAEVLQEESPEGEAPVEEPATEEPAAEETPAEEVKAEAEEPAAEEKAEEGGEEKAADEDGGDAEEKKEE